MFSDFGPPETSGVYGVYISSKKTDRKKLVYIGSSKNIKKRVLKPSHIYRRLFDRVKMFYVVVGYFETIDYKIHEEFLIKENKPFFNIRHNCVVL